MGKLTIFTIGVIVGGVVGVAVLCILDVLDDESFEWAET